MIVRAIALMTLFLLLGCEGVSPQQTNFAPCCYPNSCCGGRSGH